MIAAARSHQFGADAVHDGPRGDQIGLDLEHAVVLDGGERIFLRAGFGVGLDQLVGHARDRGQDHFGRVPGIDGLGAGEDGDVWA